MAQQEFDFGLKISFDEDLPFDRERLKRLVREMIEEGLPNGDETRNLEVSVFEVEPPKVLVVVDGGLADVRATVGTVDIAVVDVDREGADPLSEADIDDLVSFGRHEGGEEEMASELDSAREALFEFLEDGPKP